MLRGLLNKHWFIKRFVPVYIAGLIVAGFGFVCVAQALEIMKPNPAAVGTYVTELETCPNGIIGTDVFARDETDTNGVHYWERYNPLGGNSNAYFFKPVRFLGAQTLRQHR